MNFKQSEVARRNSKKLVKDLASGEFKKNYRPNHGSKLTIGLEEFYRHLFNGYIGSCGCFLMDKRLEKIGREYRG